MSLFQLVCTLQYLKSGSRDQIKFKIYPYLLLKPRTMHIII